MSVYQRKRNVILFAVLSFVMCLYWHGAAGDNTGSPGGESLVKGSPVSEDSLLYAIDAERMQMLLSIYESSQSALPEDIEQMILDAGDLALSGDYLLAMEFIDNIIIYLELRDKQEPQTNSFHKFRWSFEAFAGSDIWQQKFGIRLDDRDSSVYESQGNPSTGFRIFLTDLLPEGQETNVNLEIKHSHDYSTGMFEFTHHKKADDKVRLAFDNRFEATSYYRDERLRYWQDQAQGSLSYSIKNNITITLEDEFLIRKYASPSRFFSSFLQNEAGAKLALDTFRVLRPELRYDFRWRNYFEESERNFQEHIVTFYLWPDVSSRTLLNAFIQRKSRHYHQGFIDSLYTNNYTEYYAEIGIRHALKKVSFRLDGRLNARFFKVFSPIMPNSTDIGITPSITYAINWQWSLKLGYRFRGKKHSFKNNEEKETAQIEDFNAHGPVLSLDVLTPGGLIATLSNTFEWRRFPHAPDSYLAMYSDRNIHCLFLFLSWSIARHWELTAMASIDNDFARNIEGTDSRSNIINFELSYKF